MYSTVLPKKTLTLNINISQIIRTNRFEGFNTCDMNTFKAEIVVIEFLTRVYFQPLCINTNSCEKSMLLQCSSL